MIAGASSPLCFAYGSNLYRPDWEAWCTRNGANPTCIEPVGRALLPDMQLAFNYYSGSRGGGALNVVRGVGCAVEGVLFRVGPGGWAALDAKEGVSSRCYERVRRTAIRPDGSAIKVVVYEVTPESQDDFVPPTDEYLEIVRRGLGAYGFDPGPVEVAANGSDILPLRNIFAYGTLMQGEPLHHAMAGAAGIRPGSTPGRLHNMGHYPALLLGGNVSVSGELMTLVDPAQALPLLDEVEGAQLQGAPGGLYRRTVLNVSDGATVTPAWVYVMDNIDPVSCALIISGDWRRRAEGAIR